MMSLRGLLIALFLSAASGETFVSEDGTHKYTPPEDLPSQNEHGRRLASLAFESPAPTDSAPVQVSGEASGALTAAGFTASVEIGYHIKVPDVDGILEGNFVKFTGTLTFGSDPCNMYFWSAAVEGEIEFKLGKTDVTCELGNINACMQLVSDALPENSPDKFQPSWVVGGTSTCATTLSTATCIESAGCTDSTDDCTTTLNGSKKSCKCPTSHKVPIGKIEKVINIAGAVSNFELKLSTMLSAVPQSKGIAKLLKATGSDITWKITPGTFKAQYSGIQAGLTMTVSVMDLANSDQALVSTAATTLETAANDDTIFPMYTKSKDLIGLVKEIIPDQSTPSWITADGDNYVMRFGEISEECSDSTKTFVLTVPGGDNGLAATADNGEVLQALVALLKTAAPQQASMLPDCTESTWGAMTGFSEKLICPFSAVSLAANGDNTDISGSVNAMAGLNAGGINTVMKAKADAGTAKLKVGSGSELTVVSMTGDGCTDAEKKTGYEYACEGGANADQPGPAAGTKSSAGTLGISAIAVVGALASMLQQ